MDTPAHQGDRGLDWGPVCLCPRCSQGHGFTEAIRAKCDRRKDTRALLWIDVNEDDEPMVVSPRDVAPLSASAMNGNQRARQSIDERLTINLPDRAGLNDRVEITCRKCVGRGDGDGSSGLSTVILTHSRVPEESAGRWCCGRTTASA